MIVNIKDTPSGMLVIVIDDELLGKKFEEENKQLDLTSEFYQGESMTPNETADLMRNADHLHLVGKETITLANKEGLIDYEDVIEIAGVPHVEITRA